jgi:hypothetical protein
MVSKTNDAPFLNRKMLEVEKETETRWTEADEAHYAAMINLRNAQDEMTKNERVKVSAMTAD